MLHRFAVLTAVLTLPLIFAGATVTSKDAALAVPDWPLSYGSVFPRMVGNIVYEHGHRLIAALVGLLTLILAVWVQRAEPRRWVRVLAWSALGAVVAQGTLGGLTVLNLRPPALSATHACLAQAFFALVSAVALATSPRWVRAEAGRAGGAAAGAGAGLRVLSLIAVATVYLQVILGAAVRHGGAALSIPDFPLMFGGLWPGADRIAEPGVAIQLAHRLGAVLVLAVAGAAGVKALRSRLVELRTPAVVLLCLLPLQVLLGAAAVWSGRAYVPATAHVALGALVLVTASTLAILAFRFGVPAAAEAKSPPRAAEIAAPPVARRATEAPA